MAISKIKDSSGVEHDLKMAAATASTLGSVKPDGTSVTIDNDGTIHATANPFSVDSGGYIGFDYSLIPTA